MERLYEQVLRCSNKLYLEVKSKASQLDLKIRRESSKLLLKLSQTIEESPWFKGEIKTISKAEAVYGSRKDKKAFSQDWRKRTRGQKFWN